MNTRRIQIVLALLATFWGASVRAAEPKFPLKVSENRRHLVDQRGTPFLYNADTPWMFFTKLTEPEAKDYIVRRKEQGFSALQVMLTGFLGMTNLAGELPYSRKPPEQDFAQPNEKFFAQVDRVVAEAQRQEVLLSHDHFWSVEVEGGRGSLRIHSGGAANAHESIFTHLLPELRRAGFDESEIQQFTIRNPAEAFTIRVRKA